MFGFASKLRGRTDESWKIGEAGERAAEKYLWRRGYRIIDRNFETPFGEIDLICEQGGACIFVEVKTRRRDETGKIMRDPAERVTAHKRGRMRAAARLYLRQYEPVKFPHRFDVIAVEISEGAKPEILRHMMGAFDPVLLRGEAAEGDSVPSNLLPEEREDDGSHELLPY